MTELYDRALAARQRQRSSGRRRHPMAKKGDVFGSVKVIQLLVRDHTGNERVRVRCVCGKESDAYVFNLRKRTDGCWHARTAFGLVLPGWVCGHCRAFNGALVEWLARCRCCGAPGPKGGKDRWR